MDEENQKEIKERQNHFRGGDTLLTNNSKGNSPYLLLIFKLVYGLWLW